jgi:hypothetical protein
VNRILSGNHGKRIAVVENECGEVHSRRHALRAERHTALTSAAAARQVGVDDALVIQLQNEELLELNNGWCAHARSSGACAPFRVSDRLTHATQHLLHRARRPAAHPVQAAGAAGGSTA